MTAAAGKVSARGEEPRREETQRGEFEREELGADRMPGELEVLSRASGENFSVASLVLGRDARAHLLAIYGFARLVDQLGDEVGDDRLAHLDVLEEDLARAFDGDPEHPLLRRLTPTLTALDLPREPFQRLIEANRRDQSVVAYETFDELLGYCELSANPVGELVLRVFGAATPDRIALSNRVCTALQLAEHWQDVAEDYRNGRIYLPAEDLRRFGVAPDDLAATRTGGPLRQLLGFEVARARELLDSGAGIVGRLRGRARLAVAGYVGGGRAALDAIAAADYNVLAGAPKAGGARRARATLRTYVTGR
jgi:squalene synthase HpnC